MIVAFLILILSMATPATAQAAPPSGRSLDAAAAELRAVDRAFDAQPTAGQRDALRRRAVRAARVARGEVADRAADLTRIEAQAAQLGPVPKNIVEAADIRARRAGLAAQHATLDSTIKRGKLIAIDADQLVADIERSDAQAFSAALSARTASPLSPGYWGPVLQALPRDLGHLHVFMAAQAATTWQGVVTGRGWLALIGLIVAAALIVPIRRALHRAGQALMIDHAPANRLRRSGLALWIAILGTLVPLLAGLVLVESFRGAGMVGAPWQPLASAFLQATLIAGLITGVGGALLQHGQPSWRLLPIGDETAARLRPWVFAAAGVAILSILLGAVVIAARVSAAGTGAGDIAAAVVHLALVVSVLLVIGRIRIRSAAASVDDTADDQRLAGVALVTLVPWAAAVVAIVALLIGYVAFALMLSRLLLWLPVVLATLYLLLIATDDLCSELIAGDRRLGGMLHDAFGLRRSLIDQLGVALSAVLRLGMILFALGIAFVPFGSNFGALTEQAGQLSHGFTVGQITIAPGAILRALAVLALALYGVRVVQRWLTERYLPATELDAGARHSISTVASYVGMILAALWALAALGIGFQRIALILSALSVGIGFGLQAITQNFVSGLILLIERPVKIGDLIRVGDQEGDVKRINVRATEIVTGDKSTLIVPNSELITKTVRNLTLANPIGRVRFEFAVPLAADAHQVRAIVLGLFAEAAAVLDDPEPKVFIDSLVDGMVHFACVAYVRSPRDAYGVRSAVLFDLIAALRAAGIAIAAPETAAPASGGGAPPTEED